MQITDYGNSYVVWSAQRDPADDRVPGHMPYVNTVRILIDARCWVTDTSTGQTTAYNLISPCRTEWMYRDEVLWQQPNYEFSGIYSEREVLAGHVTVGDLQHFGSDWRVVQVAAEKYRRYEFVIRHWPQARKLADDAEVVEATMAFVPIVARTELWSDDEKLRATLEYPIRTMNVALDEGLMQVDTGPVIFPDFGASVEREIERLHWAFVCYNRDDVAEFVLRGPTPVISDGNTVGMYVDYSEVRRVPIRNAL